MSDVPDDIRETAIRIYRQYTKDKGSWSLVDLIAVALVAEREKAASLADAYADENWAMTMDTIINDPILHRQHYGPITADEDARSDSLTVDSCVHSSMHHAAKNIAAAIRRGTPHA